jgi:transcriptional regulator with PAS, ATPase and Fis domain
MTHIDWTSQFPASITVCDRDGILLEMNDKAAAVFESDGGRALIGSNMLDCHPEQARLKTERLLQTQATNVYTIEKNGKRKLIFQAPWYADGVFAGLVELALELPAEMPHFVRS